MSITTVPDVHLNIGDVVALLGGSFTPYGETGDLFHLEVPTWEAMLVLHELVDGRPGIEPMTHPHRFPGRETWRLSVACTGVAVPAAAGAERLTDGQAVNLLDRAVRLGVSLLELGETEAAMREQLVRWRFEPEVVKAAVAEAVRRWGESEVR